MMQVQNILTFSVYDKLMKKTIIMEHGMTLSEADMEVKRISNTAQLHLIEHFECNKIGEIKVTKVPTYKIKVELEEAE